MKTVTFIIKTSNGNFILTIFEKRVDIKDIPFFINIMLHLNKNGYYCPKPICDKNEEFLQELRGKPAIIVNFLEGRSKNNITIKDCYQVGSSMGLMHLYSKDFKIQRDNSLSFKGWKTLIKNCSKAVPASVLDKLKPDLMKDLQNSFDFFVKFWPQ